MDSALGVPLKPLACAQMMESLARLILAATRMDAYQIEAITTAINNMAYDAEHIATYNEDED